MTDLFTNENKTDPNKNYLEELVGEGKKFKSPEDLARGKYESDNYITILQQRFDELREDHTRLRDENAAKARMEEILTKLDTKIQDRDTTDDANDKKPDAGNSLQFDPKQIEDLVTSKLTEREVQRKQEENFNQVRDKLREQYGENYASVLEDQINEMGLTKDFFNDLARNHPSVLFKTLGLDQTAQKQSYSPPPRNAMTFKPSAPKKRTYSYYQNLRKENPKIYFDRQTAIQMHNDAQEQGEAFFDVTV